MNEYEDSWNKLFHDLNTYDIAEDLQKPENPFELKELFLDYFNDYCKISYLEDIKENDLYLINKWKLIFFHCVELDDYFFYLDKQKNSLRSFSLSPNKMHKKHEKKKNQSFNIKFENALREKSNTNSFKLEKNAKSINNLIPSDLNDTGSSLSLKPSFQKMEESDLSKDESNEIKIEEIPDNNLNEFRLTEAKKSLQIFDNEKKGGKEFEFSCRRVLNLMLLFIQKDNYKLSNPNKIPLQKIINFMKIKELEKVKLTNSGVFEIDVVINDFKVKDLKKLLNNYSSHFFLTENLNIKNEENINIIGEISRNFLIQIKNKFAQIKTYFAVFKILESLNMKDSSLTEEEKKYIFSCFDLEKTNNKNIFIIITDGSYFVLRFTLATIAKIKEQKIENKYIQSFINNEIKLNQKLLNYLMSYKFRNLNELIYQVYETLEFLDNNNIRYCLLFIDERENNTIENF